MCQTRTEVASRIYGITGSTAETHANYYNQKRYRQCADTAQPNKFMLALNGVQSRSIAFVADKRITRTSTNVPITSQGSCASNS